MDAEIERAIGLFTKAMKQKLEIRASRYRGWGDVSIEWLYIKLGEEVGELAEALLVNDAGEVAEEAVDVANIAMMIYDRTKRNENE